MKKHFFQRVFDRKSHESLPRTRRLSLESLENRELLNVDWSGFGSERVSTYVPTAEANYAVDLAESVDDCELVDLTGDGRADLIAVNYSMRTVSVYANATSSGEFALKGSQKLDSLSGIKGCDSIIVDDGKLIAVSTTASGDGITATTYTWNATSSSFAKTSEATLDVSKFNSTNAPIFVITGVSAELINTTSNDRALVVQAATLTTGGVSTRAVSFSGYGTSSFGTTSRALGAITETLMGSTTINGTDYLLLKELTATTNNLVYASVGTSVTKYTYDLSSYGTALTFDWVADYDGFVALGAMTNGKSGLITIKASTPVDETDASTLGTWTDCDDLKFNSTARAAIGNIGGDADPELFVVNGSSSLFYLGDASNQYGFVFTQDSFVVSSPDYRSVYFGGDYAILVGSEGIFTAEVDATGALGDPTSQFKFSQPVKKAVFGDFNGDGRVDVAVQYQTTVGTSLGVFQQLAEGGFAAAASRAFNTQLVDLSVGKFSQTEVDEIAALSVLTGGTKGTSVEALKLANAGLVATRAKFVSGVTGTAITAGSIYGSAFDDLAFVSLVDDKATIIKNSGGAFIDSTVSTKYDSSTTAHPNSVAIGDFNGDGYADLAVLNSSSGSNYANVAYYLRSETAFGASPSGRVNLNGTISATNLTAGKLNGDAYCDLILTRQTTAGATCVSALLGNGQSSVFEAAINKTITVDTTAPFGTTLAKIDGDDSLDFAWAQDKSIGVLLNGEEIASSGTISILCQSASSSAGATYSAARGTARTWIDEWSNFYMDVWANAGGEVVTAATATLNYNPSYFTVAGVESAPGYTATYTAESGVATVTASGTRAVDSEGWALVARVKFAPAGGEGVELPSDGVLKSVASGFGATAAAQTINGATAASVSVPNDIKLYPFIFDVDGNGTVNMNDMSSFVSCFGMETASVSNKKLRVLDYDMNGVINMNDFSYFVPTLGSSAASGFDSVYATEPTTSSSAVLDELFEDAILDLSDDAEFFEEELDAFVEDVFYGPLPQ